MKNKSGKFRNWKGTLILTVLMGMGMTSFALSPVKVFIFAGQSNMPAGLYGNQYAPDGQNWAWFDSADNNFLHFYNVNGSDPVTEWQKLGAYRQTSPTDRVWGAELHFAYHVGQYYRAIDPDARLAFIMLQRNATSLGYNWSSGGRVIRTSIGTWAHPEVEQNLHIDLMRGVIASALDQLPGEIAAGRGFEIEAFIWNQGEGDSAGSGLSKSYPLLLNDLLTDWVDDPDWPLDPAYDDDNQALYAGGLRSGLIDPANSGVRITPLAPNMKVLTTRIPLMVTETKPWGDASWYHGPINTLRVRDALGDADEAGENIQGFVKTDGNAVWMGCDEYGLTDGYHSDVEDKVKMSLKYAATYLSQSLGLGHVAAENVWPTMITDEHFEKIFSGYPDPNGLFGFGSATSANAHTRRYPDKNPDYGNNEGLYPKVNNPFEAWWTGTDGSWAKTSPGTLYIPQVAEFGGTSPGRLAQVINDAHATIGAFKLSFQIKSTDTEGGTTDTSNGLKVYLYGATTEGTLHDDDPAQPAGYYLPADFQVGLDVGVANSNVVLLGEMTVLDASSGSANTVSDWTDYNATFEIGNTGYSFYTLIFEGDNVNTASGDFLGLDNVHFIPSATGFDEWRGRIDWEGQPSSSDGDPDVDNLNNLMEYAMDTNPLILDPPTPTGSTVSNGTFFVMDYRRNKQAQDITWTFWKTPSLLESWEPYTVDGTNTFEDILDSDVDGDGTAELVRNRTNIETNNQFFFRCSITN